jgi:hypothetical protein
LKKIADRILLGVISGLSANIIKLAMGKAAMKLNVADLDGPMKATGLLVPAHKIADRKGMFVGYLADSSIAAMIGIFTVYVLSITGKDRALLKGTLIGKSMWTVLYGVLATFGASKVAPVDPKTALAEFASHSVYGATAAALAVRLGDERLFNGRIPLSASSTPGGKDSATPVPEPRTGGRFQVLGAVRAGD